MSMVGDYRSMAEACGEATSHGYVFFPGEDFDPHDEYEVEAVLMVGESDRADAARRRIRELEADNARLRGLLGDAVEDDDPDCVEPW